MQGVTNSPSDSGHKCLQKQIQIQIQLKIQIQQQTHLQIVDTSVHRYRYKYKYIYKYKYKYKYKYIYRYNNWRCTKVSDQLRYYQPREPAHTTAAASQTHILEYKLR